MGDPHENKAFPEITHVLLALKMNQENITVTAPSHLY